MKKWLIVTLFFLCITPAYAVETEVTIGDEVYQLEADIAIELNGVDPAFETPPYILKNRTIVPIKFIMDALGYEVFWDGTLQKVTCVRGDRTIEMIINDTTIIIDGESYESDVAPVIISSRTYVPLALITRTTGSEVNWVAETRTVQINEKLNKLNVFYGPSSYMNFVDYGFDTNESDSISYAWSKLDLEEGTIVFNTSSINDNRMFVPKDFEIVMTDKPSYLNIYNDDNYPLVFLQSEELIKSIKQQLLSPTTEAPDFEGVVIDFENIPETLYTSYEQFVLDLDEALPEDIEVILALQPRTFNYQKLLQSVDGIILMLHDYESKLDTIMNFNADLVYQPISPINNIRKDLEAITADLTVHEKSKLLLQLNLAVVQWQGESHYRVSRYTPGYDKLISRMSTLNEDEFVYDEISENPYVVYQDENAQYNTIWYENERSLQAKIDLVKEFDLGGISLWQMGNLPQVEETDLYQLNLWTQILKNY